MTMRGTIVWLGLAALAACGGGGSTTPTVPPPCAQGAVVDTQAVLVSPGPGATGVSPSIGTIAFAYANSALAQALVLLSPTDGSGTVSADFPAGTTTPPATGTTTRTIPALKPGTTYKVTAGTVNFAHASCYVAVSAALGSFTTQ